MNLDLLKKLTRLANNNPNDNEANLAARKVCKMLEEGNWSLNNPTPKTYNDVTRSTEPQWRSTPPNPPNPPNNPFTNSYKSPFSEWNVEDLFNYFSGRGFTGGQRADKTASQYQQQQNAAYNQQRANQEEQERIRKKQAEWDKEYAERIRKTNENIKWEKEKRKNQPKRPLNCCRCKKPFMTSFMGLVDTFKCNECYWAEYNENREKELNSEKYWVHAQSDNSYHNLNTGKKISAAEFHSRYQK